MLEQHGDRETWAQIVALYGADWFHVLLTQPARVVITFLVFFYTAWVLLFAAVYYAIDRETAGRLTFDDVALLGLGGLRLMGFVGRVFVGREGSAGTGVFGCVFVQYDHGDDDGIWVSGRWRHVFQFLLRL